MEWYRELSKCVFLFGNGKKFVSELTTNEVDKPVTAFLDRFGKVVVVAHQKVVKDDVYVVIEKKYEQVFRKHVQPYAELARTPMVKVPLRVVHTSKDCELSIQMAKGNLCLARNLDGFEQEMSSEDYEVLRLESNIPVQGIDFEHPMFLETGIDAIAWNKGCYVGQEIMARVKNYGKLKRKLVRIAYNKNPNAVMRSGEVVGTITTKGYSARFKKHLAFAVVLHHYLPVDDGEVEGVL